MEMTKVAGGVESLGSGDDPGGPPPCPIRAFIMAWSHGRNDSVTGLSGFLPEGEGRIEDYSFDDAVEGEIVVTGQRRSQTSEELNLLEQIRNAFLRTMDLAPNVEAPLFAMDSVFNFFKDLGTFMGELERSIDAQTRPEDRSSHQGIYSFIYDYGYGPQETRFEGTINIYSTGGYQYYFTTTTDGRRQGFRTSSEHGIEIFRMNPLSPGSGSWVPIINFTIHSMTPR
jgi:hypothetical protein